VYSVALYIIITVVIGTVYNRKSYTYIHNQTRIIKLRTVLTFTVRNINIVFIKRHKSRSQPRIIGTEKIPWPLTIPQIASHTDKVTNVHHIDWCNVTHASESIIDLLSPFPLSTWCPVQLFWMESCGLCKSDFRRHRLDKRHNDFH